MKKDEKKGTENSIPITPENRSNRWFRPIREDYLSIFAVCNRRSTPIGRERGSPFLLLVDIEAG